MFSDLSISIKMETEMLSPEIQKLVTDSALKYFTPEELAERSKFDESLEFLESVGLVQGTPASKRIQITLEGVDDRKITITIE